MAGLGSTGSWGKGKHIGTHSGADLCTHMTTSFWPTPLPFGQRAARPYARGVGPTVGAHEASQCSQLRLTNLPSPPGRQYYRSSRQTAASNRFPAAHRPLAWSEHVAFLRYRLTPHRCLLASPPPKPRLLAALDGCWRGLCHLCKPLAGRYRPTAAANGGKGATRRGRGGGHQRPRFACHPSRPRISLRCPCRPNRSLARYRLCVAHRK